MKFHDLNSLPIPIDIKRLDDGNGIEQTLINNSAKYHDACRLLFNSTKLNRAINKAQKRKSSELEEHCRVKRRLLDIKEQLCFICDKSDDISNLCHVETFERVTPSNIVLFPE